MSAPSSFVFPHRHLLGIEGLSRPDIEGLLDLAEEEVVISRQVEKKKSSLRGRTQINLFFEAVRAIHMTQKRVILSNLNEPVAALLEVFGVAKHAMIMRKKIA